MSVSMCVCVCKCACVCFCVYILLQIHYIESRSEISEALAKPAILRAHKHHTPGQRPNRMTMIGVPEIRNQNRYRYRYCYRYC